MDDNRTSAFSRRDFTADEEIESEPYYNDGDEDDMIRSDRSIDRGKAAYYKPARYEGSPPTSFISYEWSLDYYH